MIPVNEKGEVAVWTVPKSPANRIEGWVEDAMGQRWLKVRVTPAPEDGKANKALIRFLSKEWGVAPSSLEIVSGETSRHKKIRYRP